MREAFSDVVLRMASKGDSLAYYLLTFYHNVAYPLGDGNECTLTDPSVQKINFFGVIIGRPFTWQSTFSGSGSDEVDDFCTPINYLGMLH